MSYQDEQEKIVQKVIQRVLEEKNLWPARGLNLECTKPKYFNYQMVSEYKICVKSHKFDLCKAPKQNSGSTKCTKNRKCDACAFREERSQCVTKKYCLTCSIKKGKRVDCKELPPKCINDGKYFIYIIKNLIITNLTF